MKRELAVIAALWLGMGIGFATGVVVCLGIARRWSWFVTPAPPEQGPEERAYRSNAPRWTLVYPERHPLFNHHE